MTAPTPIPDAAVEAYRAAEVGAEGAGVRTDAIRAGLAAALPHLLPAAPSGETAPPPGLLSGITAQQHRLASLLTEMATVVEEMAALIPGGEVAAASVPARTNAQSTRADVGRITQAVADRYSHGKPDGGMWATFIAGDGDLATRAATPSEVVAYVLHLLAAPSGEQPTAEPAGEVDRA